jgi:hypothetical protein
MTMGKSTAILYLGWILLGCSVPLFALSYYGIGPDKLPLLAIAFLVVGILWQLKAAPAFSRQMQCEETAKNYEAAFREQLRPVGDERLLRMKSLRLEPEADRLVWHSTKDEVIGSVVGAYEMGQFWIVSIDSREAALLQLRCGSPGAWYRYGYKRRVRWCVAEADGKRQIGVVELRPTFLGRFRWRVLTEADTDFGQVKAGVEWSRMVVGLGGAATAAIIPNLKHHATLSLNSRPVCAISWAGHTAALTFGPGKWEPNERKLAIAVAVLLACCPNYYRHA